MMVKVLIFILVGILTAVLSFAITFTIVSLYVAWRRRDIPKYCYSKPAEPPQLKHDASFSANEVNADTVDGQNAMRDWKHRT